MNTKPGASVSLNKGRHSRLDTFMNVLTGLGDPHRDKRLAGQLAPAHRLAAGELETMYADDAIAAKIVDMLPEDMTREWVEYAQDQDADSEALVMEKLRNLHAQESFEWALKLARLHGGACIILGINDGEDYDQPLNLKTVRSINYLNVLDRWEIYPTQRIYRDPMQPKYGKPEYYRLQPARNSESSGKEIHESRLLRFDGVKLPDRYSLKNQGWGDPILNRLYNALRAYHVAHDSAATIIQDFTQGVYTFKGLAELLSGGDDGVNMLLTRLQELDVSRSIVRGFVLDEGESFTKMSTSVAGLDELIKSAERRLTAESGIPHTRLLGESPGASLGEMGDSQTRDWYDKVAAKQEAELRKPLERLIEIILRSKEGPTKGVIPGSWSVRFASLWQQDEGDMAANRYLQAQTDEKYILNNVLTEQEVAQSRFGGAGYSYDTVLDTETRDALASDPPEPEAPDV
jgi:phage-related protein (TIGR01555 family)